jgi:hypothetical protein
MYSRPLNLNTLLDELKLSADLPDVEAGPQDL